VYIIDINALRISSVKSVVVIIELRNSTKGKIILKKGPIRKRLNDTTSISIEPGIGFAPRYVPGSLLFVVDNKTLTILEIQNE